MIGSFWYGGTRGRDLAATARSESSTAESFDVREVYTDKACASIPNYEVCTEHGVMLTIAFESNPSGAGNGRSGTAVNPDNPDLTLKHWT
jgi:hypothetical protein